MKWLEIIELRSAGGSKNLLEFQLHKLIQVAEQEIKKHKIKIYNRISIIENI